MSQALQRTKPQRIYGFDYLRTLGVILVLIQHQLAVLDLKAYSSLQDVNIGQIGVSIFLAVSGALAMYGERTPENWLLSRLRRIYPAYWIVTALAFVVAAVAGYKSFSFLQVVSQMAGTGLFTHRAQLVNVVTWFVSLLLALYLVVYLAKKTKHPTFIVVLAAVSSSLLIVARIEPLIFAHALTFFCAIVMFPSGRPRRGLLLLAVVACLLLSVYRRDFVYPALALAVTLAFFPAPPAPAWVTFISRYSYEFYLCHGIFVLGSQKTLGQFPVLSIPLGILASVVAAILLNKATERLLEAFDAKQTRVLPVE